ncbi:MAG: LemA family protein [bacterium]|nr:LemA family protein [bacterium]
MKKGLVVIAVIVGLLVLVAMWFMGTYNSLVSMDVKVDEGWSQVEVQYQRRFDLIPNLVETVKGVANFEKSTYTAVTEARSAWAQSMQNGTRAEQITATNNVESALARLLVTVENYPQLKANENFSTLQAQIEGTENRVSVARQDYNQVVTPYNTKIRTFPASFVATLFGFTTKDFFGSDDTAANGPAVNFGN